jgi:hypothetical protein
LASGLSNVTFCWHPTDARDHAAKAVNVSGKSIDHATIAGLDSGSEAGALKPGLAGLNDRRAGNTEAPHEIKSAL